MKQKVKDLIERLAGGDPFTICQCGCETVQDLITIGIVIKLIAKDYRDTEFPKETLAEAHLYEYSVVPKVCALWAACEEEYENLSLQELEKNSGWAKRYSTLSPKKKQEYILQDPAIRELFTYLINVL